jgi:hypothetical protein
MLRIYKRDVGLFNSPIVLEYYYSIAVLWGGFSGERAEKNARSVVSKHPSVNVSKIIQLSNLWKHWVKRILPNDHTVSEDPCFKAVTDHVEDVYLLSIASNRRTLSLKADRKDHDERRKSS